MNSLDTDIFDLIFKCSSLGLPEKDSNDARSYLENNERGLAFDTLLTQIYEYDILIDGDIYRQIEAIARELSINAEDYAFITKLIRPNTY
ncbi:MafI family immunity protein [Larkinella rosea]|nr:MafI family immunity protein [Larkinella rosea]